MRVRGHAVWIGSPTCVRAPVPQVRPGCALTLLSSSSAIGGNATGPCGGGELECQHTECYTESRWAWAESDRQNASFSIIKGQKYDL